MGGEVELRFLIYIIPNLCLKAEKNSHSLCSGMSSSLMNVRIWARFISIYRFNLKKISFFSHFFVFFLLKIENFFSLIFFDLKFFIKRIFQKWKDMLLLPISQSPQLSHTYQHPNMTPFSYRREYGIIKIGTRELMTSIRRTIFGEGGLPLEGRYRAKLTLSKLDVTPIWWENWRHIH